MKPTALQYLNKNPLRNMSIIEPIRRGMAEILCATEEGVLIRNKKDGLPLISANSVEAGMKMLEAIEHTDLIVVHQEFLVEPIQKKYKKQGANSCYQVVYTGENMLQIKLTSDIRKLDERYLEIMARQYHLYDDPQRMLELIEMGVMHGIFVEDEFAGFIGMHEEGSMGLLEIFPKFKRRGLATELQKFMINYHLEKGWVPFGQVIIGNEESMGLQKKLGMEVADGTVTWIY